MLHKYGKLTHKLRGDIFQFSFHCVRSILNKTIIPFALVGYQLILENNPKQIHMLIGLKPYFYNLLETQNQLELFDIMMARPKRIYILMIKVNKFFCVCGEVFSVFLSSYRNTRESLGELENTVETLTCGSCSHSISHSTKLSLMFLNSIETQNVFYFFKVTQFPSALI